VKFEAKNDLLEVGV